MDEPSDGTLLADFTAGSPTALTLLVQRHQAALLRHARSLLGNGGAHEDAVQEAFLRLVEKPPVLPESALGDPAAEHAQLSSWLHRVVRNCCMDTMRSESRRRHREEVAAAPEETRGGFGSLEARDTRAAVEAGLARLPEDQREVLALRLLAERSYREIAEITGRKIGTVGWLVSVGIRALSRELAPLVGWVEGTPRPIAQEHLGFAQGERS